MELTLKINDFKKIQIAKGSYNYYLKVEFIDEECQITQCQNLLFGEGRFKINNHNIVVLVELWNYDTQQRVGKLDISRFDFGKWCEYRFKHSNLSIQMKHGYRGNIRKEFQEVDLDESYTLKDCPTSEGTSSDQSF